MYDEFTSFGSSKKGSFVENQTRNVKITAEFKGNNARVISDLSDGIRYHNISLEEILLKRGTKMRVKDLYKDKKRNYNVHLEEL